MPTSSTFAPAFCAACVIAVRLSAVSSSGRPRNASLPPSSMTTTAGWCWASSAASRERPPDVVSPLMLVLTTRAAIFSSASFLSSSATQPVPRDRPYSALSESPRTSTTLPSLDLAAGRG
jgi:hypothetical protein